MKERGEIAGLATPARRSRFLERIWLAWVAWLPFLIPMLVHLFHAHPTALQLIVTFAGTAIFVVVYVWTAWQLAQLLNGRGDPLDLLTRFWWVPVAILTTLAVMLSLFNGNAWLGLFIYTSAVVGGLLRHKIAMAIGVILLLDVLAFVCSLVTAVDVSNLMPGGILLLATGLTTLGLLRAGMTARELQSAREEIARLAVSEERLRIARDLHDLLGHHLSLIALKSELAGRLVMRAPARAVEELHDLESVAREALHETRETISGYRQPTLVTELHAAQELLAAAGIACACEIEHLALPATIEAVLANTVREGVTNVIRHSRAKHCTIQAKQDTQKASVVILDDGQQQMDARQILPRTSGNGLRGLAERVALYHGRFAAGGRAEGGFQLSVTFPLKGVAATRVEPAQADHAARVEGSGR